MSRCCRPRGAAISLVLICLLLAVGCSRPAGLHGNDGAAQGDKAQVPFQEGQSAPNSSSTQAAQDHTPRAENGLPFRDSQSLPVGTLLTVRLTNGISTDAPEASGKFEAVVEEPVSIEGSTVIPRGASVSGRVESARASKTRANRNYVRLTLDSMDIAGRDFQLQTSSLFAHGNASVTALSGDENPAAVIHLEKGRRLTFRLTEPIYVAAQQPISSR